MGLEHLSRKFTSYASGQSIFVVLLLSSFLISFFSNVVAKSAPVEDNEFAEFEEFDEAEFEGTPPKRDASGSSSKPAESAAGQGDSSGKDQKKDAPSKPVVTVESDDDGVVEEDTDEFSYLEDDEEFVNVDQARGAKSPGRSSDSGKEPSLKIANIPAHLRTSWFNFQVELIMLFGLSVYLMNYFWGKTRNHALATAWFDAHRDILDANFHVVGDDGTSQEAQQGVLIKESDSSFRVWCSGRAGCQGMSIQLKLVKRQDLVSLMSNFFRPTTDKILIRVTMNVDEMDSYVFAAGNRKVLSKLAKETMDLYQYCAEKKGADKFGLPESFMLVSEIGEATATLVDAKVSAIIGKFQDFVDYIHFSDQYSGLKPQDNETMTRLPETTKVLTFCFNVPGKTATAVESQLEQLRPLLQMVIHCIDKVRRFKLSKEAKAKADKNRQRIEESFLKTTHTARVEAAQTRKEEKIKERKDKIMNEEDPERLKRLEKQEAKREQKRNKPKMKQLKIKA